MSTVITSVDHRSPAQRAGIRPGEKLLTINGHEIVDVLDYRFYGYDAKCRLELLEPNGSVRNVQIKKEEGLDLGLNFDTYLMDEMRCCANHCVFCFVDQMPPGMRQTLYFKDDDARLSFLQGNYITLTNLTEREAQRIIDLRISPINVSVHTTDPQLHCTMLGNKNAVRSLEYMRRFCEAGIVMNGQIVICPGWNDGDQLRRTLRDLTEMEFSSCSLVPVGITKYRKGLAKLRPVDAATAAEIIDTADEFGRENLERFGTRRMQMTEHYWLVNEMEPEMRNKAIAEYMPMDVLRWQGCVPDTDETPHENLDGDVGRSIGGDNGCPPFVFAHVPISWEEDFKGKGRMVCDGPNYRWQFVIQYPDGVSEEEGERWFHEEIVPYFQARPEVNRFLSSRIYHDVVGCTFHRLVELWFDGPEEWYQAAVEGAKALPKPVWAQQERFPFLKSNFNIVGMFLTDIPTSDNLTQFRGYITMR